MHCISLHAIYSIICQTSLKYISYLE